jgi:peptidoglycan/LPS O-acetylase OafA/YrhL
MKRHYEVLDGLRGTAALGVIMYHLMEWIFPNYAHNPFRHAYLAVDFFFMLSGFVIGYAYDDRWPKMRIRDFFRMRLIRLHPLVLLGIGLGAIGYLLDPFAGSAQHANLWHLALCIALGMLMLPSPSLPNRYDETHSLNGPHWSLTLEYLINIVYAVIGRKMGKKTLAAVVVLSAAGLAATAIAHGHLSGGWGWNTLWMAPARVTFPFFMGLLIYRMNFRIRIKSPYLISSLLLLAVFAAPAFNLNAMFEAFSIIFIFPVIVVIGAGENEEGVMQSICNFSGRISYPLYILHYPFIYIFSHWLIAKHPSAEQIWIVSAACVVFFILLAWGAMRFYDEPVRIRLNNYLHRIKK